MLPLQNITQVITPVMHPIFSDYQNDLERLASGYERIVRFLAFIGLPLSVLLYFTASEVTDIVCAGFPDYSKPLWAMRQL